MNRLIFVFLGLLIAQTVCAKELFGTVEAISGEVTASDMTGSSQSVTLGLKIFAGQSIQTAADGEVHIATEDSGLIALRPNSNFRIDSYQAKGESSDEIIFSLFKGAMRSITGWIAKRNTSAYRLNTPSGTIGVRGTDHETTVLESAMDNDLPGTFDTVNEGRTVMLTALGEIEVHPGEYGFAAREAGTVPRLLAQRPNFLKHRILKIENRIQQRKDNLKQLIQRRLEERSGDVSEATGGQIAEGNKPRDAIKKRVVKRKRRIPQSP